MSSQEIHEEIRRNQEQEDLSNVEKNIGAVSITRWRSVEEIPGRPEGEELSVVLLYCNAITGFLSLGSFWFEDFGVPIMEHVPYETLGEIGPNPANPTHWTYIPELPEVKI